MQPAGGGKRERIRQFYMLSAELALGAPTQEPVMLEENIEDAYMLLCEAE